MIQIWPLTPPPIPPPHPPPQKYVWAIISHFTVFVHDTEVANTKDKHHGVELATQTVEN